VALALFPCGRLAVATGLHHPPWKALARKAGVRVIKLHEGRPSAASFARDAGVDPKIRQEQLGHTTAAITTETRTCSPMPPWRRPRRSPGSSGRREHDALSPHRRSRPRLPRRAQTVSALLLQVKSGGCGIRTHEDASTP
jgi:hypothetical protein